jgi:hypothetical protein
MNDGKHHGKPRRNQSREAVNECEKITKARQSGNMPFATTIFESLYSEVEE